MQRIKKGDQVEVIAGDDRGTRGEVNRVLPRDDRVVIHGVNLIKKHQRRTGSVRTQTGIIEFEAPVHLSNVQPVCPTCDRPVRVVYRRLPDGSPSRACRRCGHVFD
jgi:large subunit ribosomal protein L24